MSRVRFLEFVELSLEVGSLLGRTDSAINDVPPTLLWVVIEAHSLSETVDAVKALATGCSDALDQTAVGPGSKCRRREAIVEPPTSLLGTWA